LLVSDANISEKNRLQNFLWEKSKWRSFIKTYQNLSNSFTENCERIIRNKFVPEYDFTFYLIHKEEFFSF